MAIPGLLVEYLISGVSALLWLYPVLKHFGFSKMDSSYFPIMLLALYVVGMVIDFFAWALTRSIKKKIRKRAEKRYDISSKREPGVNVARNVKFALYAPEIAKEVAMRSSRDRIARGAIINSLLATVFVLPTFVGIGLTCVMFIVWVGFEDVSYSYELKAEQAINQKIQQDMSEPIEDLERVTVRGWDPKKKEEIVGTAGDSENKK